MDQSELYKTEKGDGDINFCKELVDFIEKDKSILKKDKENIIKKVQKDFGVKEFLLQRVSKNDLLNIVPMYETIYTDFITKRAKDIENYFKIYEERQKNVRGVLNQCPNMLFYRGSRNGKKRNDAADCQCIC